jgi:CRP-like cAMP-binding protein
MRNRPSGLLVVDRFIGQIGTPENFVRASAKITGRNQAQGFRVQGCCCLCVYKGHKRVTLPPHAEFLADMRGDQLTEILDAAETRKISAQQIILREGALPTHVFLLKSGQVKLYRLTHAGDEVLLSLLVPGDTFGLGTLLSRPMPYIGTAETTRDSELLVWRHSRIRRLAQKYPRLAQNALGIVVRYLHEHLNRLFDLVSCTAAERLARVVLHLSRKAGRMFPTGIEINATNDELAAQANVSPFTASRLLNRWLRIGALNKSRGKVFIKSPEKLLCD